MEEKFFWKKKYHKKIFGSVKSYNFNYLFSYIYILILEIIYSWRNLRKLRLDFYDKFEKFGKEIVNVKIIEA